MDRNSALPAYKPRQSNDTANRLKKNINKNICPKDGLLRLLQITYEDYTDWSYVLSHIEHLLWIFQKCLIVIENFNCFVFTSVSEQLLFRIQTCLHKSRPVDTFINLIRNFGEQNSYFIATDTDNKSYVFPKCADTIDLFAAIKDEKRNLLASKRNVCFSDVFKMAPNLPKSESKHSKDMLEGSSFENCNKLNPYKLSESKPIKRQVLCRPKPCQHCLSYLRKQLIKSVSKKMPQKQISLKRAMKVMPSRYEAISRVYPLNGEYPTQASSEQDVNGHSAISFSNGVSIPVLSTSGTEYHQQASVQEDESSFNFSLDSTAAAPRQPRESQNSVYTSSSQEHTNITSNIIFEGQRRAPRYSHYVDEITRRRSFDHWPHSSPSAYQLSAAGFFHTGEEDLVRCFQCGIGLRDFSNSDNPLLEHVRYSGNCEYLFDHLGPTRLSQLQETTRSQHEQVLLQNQSGSAQMYPNSCRHPEYRTAEARMASFLRWPPTVMQRPADLVEAGFYYTGVEDHVRCFTCDGGLRKWDPEDDPWTEHCRWFPTCRFARQVKGDEYIRLVQASAELDDGETSVAGGSDLTRTMAEMQLRDPQFQAILKEHKQACLDMGFKEDDFNETVEELRNRGNLQPTLEDIVDSIGVVVENRETAKRLKSRQNETPEEQNKRLKSFLICILCEENKVNALFLPCTHHRLCMDCAEFVDKCPVCDRIIREKIKTYMA